MIDESQFGKSSLDDLVERTDASTKGYAQQPLQCLGRVYARRGVKVAVDNLAATGFAGLVGAAAVHGVDGSSIDPTIASWTAFNISHPFIYGILAASTNRALSYAGFGTRSVTRELSEGYGSGLALFTAYNAIVAPIQAYLNTRGFDPAQTVIWCNLIATALITPVRSGVYVGMDWMVDRVKPTVAWLGEQTRSLIEREEDPEADA